MTIYDRVSACVCARFCCFIVCVFGVNFTEMLLYTHTRTRYYYKQYFGEIKNGLFFKNKARNSTF